MRPAFPLGVLGDFGRGLCAPPFCPAHVAELGSFGSRLIRAMKSSNTTMIKTLTTPAILVIALTMLGGCASPRKGSAYGHEQEFRHQLLETVPVKTYGYSIKDLRFTDDYEKALVVFTHSDSTTRPDWEVILASDGFGRYRGTSMQPFYTPGTGSTPPIQFTVALPSK